MSSASPNPEPCLDQPDRTTASAPSASSLSVSEPNQAERMEAVYTARRVAEDRDEPLRLSAAHVPA